jgi:hypothetical protein
MSNESEEIISEENERYETVELVIKSRSDGRSWFDVIYDLVTEECQGDGDEKECTCGLQTMGGSGGTLEQCYDYSTTVGDGLQPIDLARTIDYLAVSRDALLGAIPEEVIKVIDWAEKEIAFEDYFENKGWETEDEDSEGQSFSEYYNGLQDSESQ